MTLARPDCTLLMDKYLTLDISHRSWELIKIFPRYVIELVSDCTGSHETPIPMSDLLPRHAPLVMAGECEWVPRYKVDHLQ